MPFYEYQCAACGAHHEELQKVTDRPLRKCPACGRGALRRLVSAPVFRLKGGGWYETDFKADQEQKRNLAGDKEPVSDAPRKETAATPSPEPAAGESAPGKEASGAAKSKDKTKPLPARAARARKAATQRPARK